MLPPQLELFYCPRNVNFIFAHYFNLHSSFPSRCEQQKASKKIAKWSGYEKRLFERGKWKLNQFFFFFFKDELNFILISKVIFIFIIDLGVLCGLKSDFHSHHIFSTVLFDFIINRNINEFYNQV